MNVAHLLTEAAKGSARHGRLTAPKHSLPPRYHHDGLIAAGVGHQVDVGEIAAGASIQPHSNWRCLVATPTHVYRHEYLVQTHQHVVQ